MKCVIPGVNIKVFGRAVHSLAKIGDELYIEPQTDGVSFRTVNSSRSAFASFIFGKAFFTQYDDGAALGIQEQQHDGGDDGEDDDSVKCKVPMKGFVNAFKSVSNLERTVERCKLMMDCNEGKMVVTLICRYGIIKTFNIVFIECETLQAVYNTHTCTNRVCAPSRVLYEAVSNFRCTQEEVTLSFTPTKAVFKTHMDEPDPSKAVHTVVTLQPGEFESYNISNNSEITFCLKELKALLLFTEPVCMCVRADFTEAGSPVILSVDNKPMFEGTFVLATLSQRTDTQTDTHVNTTSGDESVERRGEIQKEKEEEKEEEERRRRGDESEERWRKREKVTPHPTSTPHTPHTPPQHSFTNKVNPIRSQMNNNNNTIDSQMNISLPNVSINNEHTTNQNNNLSPRQQPKQHNNNNNNNTQSGEHSPSSPPSKRARHFFRRCFESTFDPNCIPGYDVILAEDSDQESN